MTDDRLSDLLLQWEERYEEGEDVPAQELCQHCPRLAAPLAEAIADLKPTIWLNHPVNKRVVAHSMSGLNGAASLTAVPNSVLLPGRYRLEVPIAEGGFGRVWKGFDLELQRLVAIKVPHRRLVSRPEDAEAYLTEARTVASLDHPNIVPVYRRRQHRGLPLLRRLEVHRRQHPGPAGSRKTGLPWPKQRNWWRRWPRRCTTPTARVSSTGTSSPAISCWTSAGKPYRGRLRPGAARKRTSATATRTPGRLPT